MAALYREVIFMKEMQDNAVKTQKKPKKKGLAVKVICYAAAFVALSVVTNVFEVYLGVNASNKLSFNYTVCFFAGAFLGPFVGFIVGALGDVLGYLINPAGGAFNPAITVVTGLIGTISGLVFWIAKKRGKGEKDILLTVLSYVLILLVCTNLNTLSMYFYYMSGKYSTFWAYYIVRTPKQMIFWAANLVVSVLLIKPLKKVIRV